jgi:hypothetical protein
MELDRRRQDATDGTAKRAEQHNNTLSGRRVFLLLP